MIIITAIAMLMTTSKAPPIGDPGGMAEGEAAALYRLMTWLSPSFPVGAFSYSSGIEWAAEAGDIGDAASLRDWLASMLADGAGFCDGVFLAHAHRAATSCDDAALAGIAELAAGLRAVARAPARDIGARPRVHRDRAAPHGMRWLDQMISCCGGAIVYPVAVGLVSAAHAIPLAPTMPRLPARADLELGFPPARGLFPWANR